MTSCTASLSRRPALAHHTHGALTVAVGIAAAGVVAQAVLAAIVGPTNGRRRRTMQPARIARVSLVSVLTAIVGTAHQVGKTPHLDDAQLPQLSQATALANPTNGRRRTAVAIVVASVSCLAQRAHAQTRAPHSRLALALVQTRLAGVAGISRQAQALGTHQRMRTGRAAVTVAPIAIGQRDAATQLAECSAITDCADLPRLLARHRPGLLVMAATVVRLAQNH
jgi:hypothetical protein